MPWCTAFKRLRLIGSPSRWRLGYILIAFPSFRSATVVLVAAEGRPALYPAPGSADAEQMSGIPAKKSRDRLDNALLIDVPGILRIPVGGPITDRIGRLIA